jgi:uncharacterized protein YprB with RNaseH-like and TPR domain/predicted nuclease with RNAse H fold/dephospho-CoA kinase
MLENSFIHFRGIGFKKELDLWQAGTYSWKDWQAGSLGFIENAGSKLPDNELALFRKALKDCDAEFFAERMPRSEYYRIAVTFPKRTLFLDIETTGLSIYYDSITVVGWSYNDGYNFFIQGTDESKLRDILADARAIVTFNGSLFDIPFLQKEFPGAHIPHCHVDLRFFAKRVGLSGGQKAIEKRLNIMTRPKSVSELKGENAPLLWSRYCWGDASALDTLLTYNRADVEGMKVIFDHVVQKVLSQKRVPATIRNIHRFANGKRNLISTEKDWPDQVVNPIHCEYFKSHVSIKSLDVLEGLRIIGIDLSGSENRPSGWCLLDGNFATTVRLSTNTELIDTTIQARPTLISIDSPLSIPEGRTSVRDDDPERSRGIMRYCERLLKKRGVNVYPCLIPSMQRLTERGMMLADTFRKMGIAVIESYPGAAQDIMGIPRKRASLELLAKGLENFGVSGDFTRIQVSHDELDAITSAIVGLYFWGGRFEAIGKEEEEFLIIPDLRIDPHPWRQRSVIGLSGPIAAGKTTAAKLLESKGYHYGRFSQVLEVMLKNKGMEPNRAALQRIGEEVNKTKGQRWLGRRLLDGFVQSTTLVIDGLRFPEDHAFMKETFGPGFIHVHLTAPKSMRLQRYVVRTGNKKEFLKAANHEVENQVKKLYSLANFVVNNEGDIRELETEISRIVLDNVASGKRYS